MKLSVFSVVTPDLTPEELAQAAQDAGLDGIEWRFKDIPADAQNEQPSFWRRNLCSIDPAASDEELERFASITKQHGLETVSVVPYLTAGDLAATERVLEVAQKLGAKMIRAGVPSYDRSKNYNELYELEVRYLEGVQKLSQKYGIRSMIETHHVTIAPSAGLAHRLVSGLDPNLVGVLFDPGNMIHEGYENFRMGLELLGPYLAHVHIKNTGWVKKGQREDGSIEWESVWEPIDGGIVSWSQVFADLKSVGYDGYIGVEDFSRKYDSKELLKKFAEQIRPYLG
ncbi:sugar phosphate isomerase/epimerase family protein [Paenibacillus thalictri]|uniref:Sugar phosphate isomerase/epimerase n=1 Tax=Paenibacillus thalictri TaxID=2527873 RepID=A0A4Q9DCE2_9BACL|nr:sugar phosphate isomerase/epimerase family protein [Paenibacillus thalictri]TBL68020.1 sugar phosphate isomerase/epimerase [Paenibacillus thalictri]